MEQTTPKKTVAQYDAELLEINNHRDRLAEQANALRKERDLAFAQETITQKVTNMGAAEREATRRALDALDAAESVAPATPSAPAAPADQTINVHGIGSGENVGATTQG